MTRRPRPSNDVSTLANGFSAISTFAYEDAPDVTRVRVLFTGGRTVAREEAAGVRELVADLVERGQANLQLVLANEMARREKQTAEAPPEPVTPESRDRELREPVRHR